MSDSRTSRKKGREDVTTGWRVCSLKKKRFKKREKTKITMRKRTKKTGAGALQKLVLTEGIHYTRRRWYLRIGYRGCGLNSSSPGRVLVVNSKPR